ncbi:mitochondrial intermembrane space import and assembly protein 40-B [Trichonephila inaurata madagascariensis]|uniref:Mitochondrial intermembrane space import and assembly protein 40-B n=1 Tax=Trichonephila inaurata madagascariensis TaxID=2747483 RepID=A0A8X6MDA6_9ARAC|nr:mitochondrial intermembrane space import and assembly protein 40-B [Trichonephila inaurata madagascariensis]
MSYCVSHGKDKVMFLTEEDLKGPSSVVLPEIEQPRGALLPNGEINWSCPCLGNAPIGPCSVEFRESLSCFHKSQSESKGSECMKEYFAMTDCFAKYPELYKRNDKDSQSLEAEKEVLDSLDEDEESSKTTISESDVSSK